MRPCSLCDRLFDCEPKGPCWCESVKAQGKIRKGLESCVCPECLAGKTSDVKIDSQLAPRQGQRPALPFQRGDIDSFLDRLKKQVIRKK